MVLDPILGNFTTPSIHKLDLSLDDLLSEYYFYHERIECEDIIGMIIDDYTDDYIFFIINHIIDIDFANVTEKDTIKNITGENVAEKDIMKRVENSLHTYGVHIPPTMSIHFTDDNIFYKSMNNKVEIVIDFNKYFVCYIVKNLEDYIITVPRDRCIYRLIDFGFPPKFIINCFNFFSMHKYKSSFLPLIDEYKSHFKIMKSLIIKLLLFMIKDLRSIIYSYISWWDNIIV